MWEVVPGGYRVGGEMLLLEQRPAIDEPPPLPAWLIVLMVAALASVVAVVVLALT